MRNDPFRKIVLSIYLLISQICYCYAVEIVDVSRFYEDGYIRSLLPEPGKNTIILVNINGIPFGEFLSGGRVSGYQISPDSVYGKNKIKEIAKAMFDAGLRIENTIIEAMSSLAEEQFIRTTAGLNESLTSEFEMLEAEARNREEAEARNREAFETTKQAINQTRKRHNDYIRNGTDYYSIGEALSNQDEQKYMEIYLNCCMHAESAFVDRWLRSQSQSQTIPQDCEIMIYGNRDPCFQCQIILSKLSTLQRHRISYFSSTSFVGPCNLPREMCNHTHINMGYTPGCNYATRSAANEALLEFKFIPGASLEVNVFNTT